MSARLAGPASAMNRRPYQDLKIVQRPKPKSRTNAEKKVFEFTDMMFADLQRETLEMQEEYNNKRLRNSPDLFKDPKFDVSPLEPRAQANRSNFNDVGISLIIPEAPEPDQINGDGQILNSFCEDGNPFETSVEFTQGKNQAIIVLEYYKLELA